MYWLAEIARRRLGRGRGCGRAAHLERACRRERLELQQGRERAALAWTEAITLIGSSHASDEIYEEARKEFTEEELVNLTIAIVAINGWNRLAIGFRTVPGTYQPAAAQNAVTS